MNERAFPAALCCGNAMTWVAGSPASKSFKWGRYFCRLFPKPKKRGGVDKSYFGQSGSTPGASIRVSGLPVVKIRVTSPVKREMQVQILPLSQTWPGVVQRQNAKVPESLVPR
jgi:hypothetical protein